MSNYLAGETIWRGPKSTLQRGQDELSFQPFLPSHGARQMSETISDHPDQARFQRNTINEELMSHGTEESPLCLCPYLCLTKQWDILKWWLFKALCVQWSVAYQQIKRSCSMGTRKKKTCLIFWLCTWLLYIFQVVNNISYLYAVTMTWTGYDLKKEERALNGCSRPKPWYISFSLPLFVILKEEQG